MPGRNSGPSDAGDGRGSVPLAVSLRTPPGGTRAIADQVPLWSVWSAGVVSEEETRGRTVSVDSTSSACRTVQGSALPSVCSPVCPPATRVVVVVSL